MFIAARSPAARVGFANVSALLRVPQLWDRQVEIYEAVASSPIFPIMSTLPMKRSRKLPLRWNLRLQQSAPASSQELRRCSPRMAAQRRSAPFDRSRPTSVQDQAEESGELLPVGRDSAYRCLFTPHMRAGLDSHQQRPRLSDLGHFGRWRKPFERGREDGVRFREAAVRLIELG